jgi:glutathione synthase/RimK-type ligase-like ATP-grasp enzyme
MIDWRDPEENVRYSVSSIDRRDQDRCWKMLATLGLTYGAFDFIRRADGGLVFLEVNPTGEWAWLEDRLGFPMRDAFVDMFFGSR